MQWNNYPIESVDSDESSNPAQNRHWRRWRIYSSLLLIVCAGEYSGSLSIVLCRCWQWQIATLIMWMVAVCNVWTGEEILKWLYMYVWCTPHMGPHPMPAPPYNNVCSHLIRGTPRQGSIDMLSIMRTPLVYQKQHNSSNLPRVDINQ